MSDVPQSIVFAALEQIRQDMQAQHTRLRTDMMDCFDKLDRQLERHERDDRAVANRVLIIETQRQHEQGDALKRGAWAALIGAAGLTAAWEGIKKLAGW